MGSVHVYEKGTFRNVLKHVRVEICIIELRLVTKLSLCKKLVDIVFIVIMLCFTTDEDFHIWIEFFDPFWTIDTCVISWRFFKQN